MEQTQPLIPMPKISSTTVPARKIRVTQVRYVVQTAVVILLILLPFTGFFHIDLSTGRFVIAGYQVWWSDFFLILPFWIFVISAMAAIYALLGMVYCGWACIQNTFSEWTNALARIAFGSESLGPGFGEVRLSPVRHKKETLLKQGMQWTFFLGGVLLFSLLVSVLITAYVIPPATLGRDLITGRDRTAYWLVFGIGGVMFLNLLLVRHYWCKWVCPYPLWQHMFKTDDTLKVAFDHKRRGECTGCNLCVNSCFIDIDPRDTKNYTRCINCGECVVACEDYSAKRGLPSLLTFHKNGVYVEADGTMKGRRLSPGVVRFLTAGSFSLFPLSLFIYGIVTYAPYHVNISQVPGRLDQFEVGLYNKTPRVERFVLEEKGLPEDRVTFDQKAVTLPPGDHLKVHFTVTQGKDLGPGLHNFMVRVRAYTPKPAEFRQDATIYIVKKA
jgi:polyferredoxin